MDYNTAYSYIESESNHEILVYVAIGCSLDTYPPNEHPPQQYPPYLREFNCPQICVLIDPKLEMPPRLLTDLENIPDDITILPIQQEYHHTSQYGISTEWFLDKIGRLCIDKSKSVKLIVQDYTGADIHPYYPTKYGNGIQRYVLYDPTYGDGSCYVDFKSIQIFRDNNGDFIQPHYLPLRYLRMVLPPAIFKAQIRARKYPVIHLMLRFYRIIRGLEEPRDWCTIYNVQKPLDYFSFMYGIADTNFEQCLHKTLMAIAEDLTYLSGVRAILESSGKELETIWNVVMEKSA